MEAVTVGFGLAARQYGAAACCVKWSILNSLVLCTMRKDPYRKVDRAGIVRVP